MAEPARVLVVQPNWVGDAILAGPTLRALRQLYPSAHITYLLRRYVKQIYTGMPWFNRLITYRTSGERPRTGRGLLNLAARLRAGRFDMAVLLPNSFKMALLCKVAGIPRIVGYDRDGRGFLLTDRLLPAKEEGRYVPTPIVRYYLSLAQYLGWRQRDTRLELFVTAGEEEEGRRVLRRAGVDQSVAEDGPRAGRRPVVLINPGAQYGDAKCWPPANFAHVADRLIDELGATVMLSGAARERGIIDAVRGRMKRSAADLAAAGVTLGSLKSIIRKCDLVITNDTGARHMAAALGTAVVTIFGPTDPRWTEINYDRERQVMVKVFCGPCQKKKCPLDHRCMTRVTASMVFDAAVELLKAAHGNTTGTASAASAPLPEAARPASHESV